MKRNGDALYRRIVAYESLVGGEEGRGGSIFPIDRRINTFFSFLSLPSVSVLFFYRVSWNRNNRISRCSFNSFYLTTCYLVSSLHVLRFPPACARLHLYNRPLDDHFHRSTFFSYRRSHAKRPTLQNFALSIGNEKFDRHEKYHRRLLPSTPL